MQDDGIRLNFKKVNKLLSNDFMIFEFGKYWGKCPYPTFWRGHSFKKKWDSPSMYEEDSKYHQILYVIIHNVLHLGAPW